MLSMTFVSMLLIAIALLTIQISNTYTRGITLRQVNVAGQELGNDFQRTVQAAQSIDIDRDYVVFMTSSPQVLKGSDAYDADPNNVMGGRLCLQGQSYVWNTGHYLNEGVYSNNPNANEPDPSESLRLVRVDEDMCTFTDDGSAPAHYMPLADSTAAKEELLRSGDRDLAVHKMLVRGDAAIGLYSISFTIGTNRADTLEAGSDRCRPPSDQRSDIDYCSVNRFDIVARTIPDKSIEEE